MLGHAEHLHLDVIGTIEDRFGAWRFRQREERPLHQVALIARAGVAADHHERIEPGPLALARWAPPFLFDTERHSARSAFGRGQSAGRENALCRLVRCRLARADRGPCLQIPDRIGDTAPPLAITPPRALSSVLPPGA